MKFPRFLTLIFFLFLVSVSNAQAQNFENAVTKYNASSGMHLARSQKIRPDDAMYALIGKIQQADEAPWFFANTSVPEESELLAKVLRRSRGEYGESTDYFGVIIPSSLEKYYFDNASIGGGFDLVGKYVDNIEYETIAGQKKKAPVFEAVYFDLWSNRRKDSIDPAVDSTPTKQTGTPKSYEDCIEESDGNMQDMIQCGDEEAAKQDKRLNSVYELALQKTPNKSDFQEKQRQWIKTRDQECAVDEEEYSGSSGASAAMISLQCLINKTKARADELDGLK
jgi:uncharacterized protein YecT (DUF1311 family)